MTAAPRDTAIDLCLSKFDEDVRQALTRFPPPLFDLDDVPAARSACREYFQRVAASSTAPPPADLAVEELSVRSLVDDHPIPVRVYRPLAPQNGRGLLYIHGGGFVMGDLDIEDARCRVMAQRAGCVVVSVDYRLAPEHPFPVPLDDCHSALRWVVDNADRLGVDLRRLGVGGCSAGGALAAGLAIRCRDASGPALALQLVLYPVLDASMSSASLKALNTAEDLRLGELMWQLYLGAHASTASELASPARCGELAGLPPAYVVAGELDGLRDEAIAYAQRLLDAGVSTELHVWPRAPHAVDLFAPDASVSRDSVEEQARALARFLG